MSTRSDSSPSGTRGGPPGVVRVAAALVGLQGAAGMAFGAFLLVGASAQAPRGVFGEVGMFVVLGAAVLAVAWGLLRGRFWARTPAIVVQLLLLPVAYSLLVPSHQVVAGLLVGVVVLAALLLLLSGPAKHWALELDDERRRRG